MVRRILLIAIASSVVLLAMPEASAAAIKEIEEASEEARLAIESGQGPVDDELARLEAALQRGEEINGSLRAEVERLERLQGILMSGLIGALVTATVAIAGAILSSRNSKPERDLKRLAVLEKVLELRSAGIQLPSDIDATYQALPSSRTDGAPKS